MKRIFTLLFCIGAIALASHADTPIKIERCVEYLVYHNLQYQPSPAQLADLDSDHNGIINMDDLTTLIDEEVAKRRMAMKVAPKNNGAKVKGNAKKAKLMPISRTIRKPNDIEKRIKKEPQH